METARPPTTAHPPARTIQLNFETILEKSTFFIIWRAGGCAVVGGRAVSIKYLKSMEPQFLNTVSHVIVAHLDRFLAQFEITFEIASFSSHFQFGANDIESAYHGTLIIELIIELNRAYHSANHGDNRAYHGTLIIELIIELIILRH